MKKLQFTADMAGLSDALDFLMRELKAYKFDRRTVQEAMLLSEENLIQLIDAAEPGAEVHLSLCRRSGLARIEMSCPGREITEEASVGFDLNVDDMGRGSEDTIRGMLLSAYGDKLRRSRKGNFNFVRITAGMAEKAAAIRTGWAFLAALVFGWLVAALAGPKVCEALLAYLLDPIDTIFINALKLIAGPMVFFAIVTAITQYMSFSDPGRVSIKVIIGYAFTSICAILIGILISRLLHPGTLGSMSHFAVEIAAESKTAAQSIVEYFVGVVPPNIIDPFLNVDTLQIIFLALLCGLAMGRIGSYSSGIRSAVDALNSLFSKVTEMLTATLPVIVFFTTFALVVRSGIETLLSLFELFGTLIVGMLAVLAFYMLLVLLFGRLNPIVFMKKYAPHIPESFICGSAVAVLPKTVRLSQKKFGISPRVTSFALPFGAMANMDGNCLYLTISSFFLARLVGAEISGHTLVLLCLSIFVLSIGAPIAPGSLLLGLTVLLNEIGVSVSAVTVLLGVNAIFEMMQAIANTMGDVVISTVIANSEGLLNKEVYYAKTPEKKKK